MKTLRKPLRKTKKNTMEKTLPILIGTATGVVLTSLLTLSIGSLTSKPQQGYTNTQAPQLREIIVEEKIQSLPGRLDAGTPNTQVQQPPMMVQSRQNKLGGLPPLQPIEKILQNEGGSEQENLPLGFGLRPNPEENTALSQPHSITEHGEETEETQAEMTQTESTQSLEADPREFGVTANEGPNKEYEETIASVQRTLTAVDSKGDKQLIRLKIPVMYQSRNLLLDETQTAAAQATLAQLKEKKASLEGFRKEIEAILQDWNKIVESSTPNALLLPESPSLPQNQSKAPLNRNTHPALSPGKNISYETP
jgi:hypothetical protein